MAETYTSNLGLTKPDYDSPADISVINSNMDKIDNAVANAGKVKSVNGKSPDAAGAVTLNAEDVGALATDDTAANSAKLGGKSSEYYIQPWNILDNSYFINPVEQAGRNGLHGTQKYAIDRWIASQGINAYSQPGNDLVLVSDKTYWTAGITQRIDTKILSRNEVYTFAVYAYINNTCRLYVHSSNDGFGVKYYNGYDRWEIYTVNFTIPDTFTEDYVNFFISPDTEMTGNKAYLKWAAVYKGSYTADTLPPYVPKGYVQELAECLRYRVPIADSGFAGLSGYNGTSTSAFIPTPVEMRKLPSLDGVANSSSNWRIYTGSNIVTPTSVTVTKKEVNGVEIKFVYGQDAISGGKPVICILTVSGGALNCDM